MLETFQTSLSAEDVQFAIATARASIEKWSEREGYYNNRLDSHFKGKLGEIAFEKHLLQNGFKIDSHFRFPEREHLSDIVIKIRNYTRICRLEVKTWDAKYWGELGRCISVDQYPVLCKKADLVVWCVIESENVEELLTTQTSLNVSLAGWSTIQDVVSAPVKDTGTGGMRKVRNYQLAQADLRPIYSFSDELKKY